MAAAIEVIGPCTQKRGRGSPYESLLHAIAHQQVHGNAALAILGRVKRLYPGIRYPTPEELVATSDTALRNAGLSRAKVAAMKDVAARTLDGTVPDRRRMARLGDEEIIERLSAVRGVGRWTAEMILMSNLNRPDVLPVGDFGIRLGYQLPMRSPRTGRAGRPTARRRAGTSGATSSTRATRSATARVARAQRGGGGGAPSGGGPSG